MALTAIALAASLAASGCNPDLGQLPAFEGSVAEAALRFGDLPAEPDPVRLQMARNFMTNTLNAFVGSLGTSGLLDRIDKCDGHQALRDLYDEWYHAIVMSRDGKREAESLRTKLLNVI